MSSNNLRTPKPICEACWVYLYSKWEFESVNEDGQVLISLVDIQMPKKYNLRDPEMCSRCGSVTISGIFDTGVAPDRGSVHRATYGVDTENEEDIYE